MRCSDTAAVPSPSVLCLPVQRHVRSVDLLLFGFGSDFRFWLCDVFHLFFLASLVAAASDDDDDGSTPHSTTLLLDSPPSPL